MKNNSYQSIKQYVYEGLEAVEGQLQVERIHQEIEETKRQIKELGLSSFAKFLRVVDLEELNVKDWERMKRELETEFDVAMESGILVQGFEQQKRDNSWWTVKEKQKNENYYWKRYKEYMSRTLVPEVIKTTDEDTDNVMNNIGDPLSESFSRLGMVVGHVQSGKTSNYTGLICKAADAGYKFIVVIAGAMNNLRDQTQARLNESFVGRDSNGYIGTGKLRGLQSNRNPISLTTAKSDFNRRDARMQSQGMSFDNINSPVLVVIKKHPNSLKNVIKWINSHYNTKVSKHAMLLIDDESDYASVNTATDEKPATINKLIRKLLNLFEKSSYVAYTATPYANIFINHLANNDEVGADLFPRDFIYALNAPKNYFGARKVFIETYPQHIRFVEDHDDFIDPKHKKDDELIDVPQSLYRAIRHFVINIGIRHLRQQENKHNSMLVHATRFTNMHQKVSVFVYDYVNKLQKELESYGNLPMELRSKCIIDDLEETYREQYQILEFSWEEVFKKLVEISESIMVREVHNDSKLPVEYSEEVPTNAIVIGGTSLSRGYTLEGLSVSYFLRNTVYYDTLMQMGRWFGYRNGYEDLCYVYMPEKIAQNFATIIEATEDLVEELNRMARQKKTPNDFGLAVKFHPDTGLQVTAKNKLKNSLDTTVEMKLDGTAKETSWLFKEESINRENLNIIEFTVNTLVKGNIYKYEKVNNSHLWRDVDGDLVLEFLHSFRVFSSDQFGINSRMPIKFVIEYAQRQDTKWDIALYSGGEDRAYKINEIFINKEERQILVKDDYYEIANRQVSSGGAETISLLDEKLRKDLRNKRKEARGEMKNPLLMLHIIDGKIVVPKHGIKTVKGVEKEGTFNFPTGEEVEDLAAFGVSFPDKPGDFSRVVRLKLNTVAIQEMWEDEGDEGEVFALNEE
ncbi:MAG TPA: endonuclease [Paenibacillus sp.]|uniref:Z1 domain-containing protein n=1 Tax=Paenibacillus TaxID=44249 RepID=UPI000BA1290C|nr:MULTISPECIES: Z1 domain-containing protein [Paenibacillus]OZQ60637.1 endonuclease [Paenibacillus taichungensis]HBU80986.1 endonuclease [Paenibacillus sp.]